jgi:hypothetical protein
MQKRGASKKILLEKNGLKKCLPYFDLNEAQDATHAIHGIDPLLLALQGAQSLSPNFLKQRSIVTISCLFLLDIANFIIV